MTHALWAQEASPSGAPGMFIINHHYLNCLELLLCSSETMTSNFFLFNEGSSFLLICFIPTVITHTQELLYSLLHSFILEFRPFHKSDNPGQRNPSVRDVKTIKASLVLL